MSNFDFLKPYAFFAKITRVCLDAEASLRVSNAVCEVQTDDFWKTADLFAYEKVRCALRDLLQLLDHDQTTIYYTSFLDEVLFTTKKTGEYTAGEFQDYRKKVNAYLRDHQNDLVVHKLRHNKELTGQDFKHMEHLLWNELGSREEYENTFGDQSLNSHQLGVVQLIVKHVVANGYLEKNMLNEQPFTQHGNLKVLFDDKIEVPQKIVAQINRLNRRIAI